MTTRIIDLHARRQQQRHRCDDERAAELKAALRSARTGADASPTSRLLDLYRRKKPPQKP